MEKFSLRYVKPQAYFLFSFFLILALIAAQEYSLSHWGYSISIIAIMVFLFKYINGKLWNWSIFKWMYNVPDFTGRYEGELKFEFRKDDGEKISGTLEHIKIIHQNGSDVVINSWTKKTDGSMSSKSQSLNSSIVKREDGTFELIYNYYNEGDSEQGFSGHHGTEVLKLIESKDGNRLVGNYYTERQPYQTKGKIDLNFKNKYLTHLN